ncbi:Lipid A core - O-antigen ligase and related enzymes [Serratia ficaria]|nr:Lipid A core - O-antigen ligase and related enzymes [Serratia ficaria]
MLFSVYFLFLMPKINLISVGDFNAGLRIDDAIIALWLLVFILHAAVNKKTVIKKTIVRYYLFLLAMLIGTVVTFLVFNQGSIIFPFRFLEYFTLFFMGAYLATKEVNISALMKCVLYLNVIVSALQFAGVVGGFTVMGYVPTVSGRVIGLTSGPWELGVILNFVTCYFLASAARSHYKYFVFAISLVVIFLSGSRMSFVAQIMIMVIYIFNSTSAVGVIKRVMIIVPFILVALLYLSDSVIAERSENLFNMDNITALPEYYRNTTLVAGNPDWSTSGVLDGNDVDASWAIRSIKWMYALKLFMSNPMFIITGVGAGTFGNALDGGWLRLFTECGIIGALFFVSFLNRCKQASVTMKYFFVAFAINMLMIDIYMSYKVMAMLLFVAGYMTTFSSMGIEPPKPRMIKIKK